MLVRSDIQWYAVICCDMLFIWVYLKSVGCPRVCDDARILRWKCTLKLIRNLPLNSCRCVSRWCRILATRNEIISTVEGGGSYGRVIVFWLHWHPWGVSLLICLSVRRKAWNISRIAGYGFVKFDVRKFYELQWRTICFLSDSFHSALN